MNQKTAFLAALLVFFATIPLGFSQGDENTPKVVERYKLAQAKYKDRVEAYRDARTDFLSAREKVAVRKNSNESALRLARAKTFLLRSTDAMISHLEVMKTRTEVSSVLPEGQTLEAIHELESHIEWLESAKIDVESANTKEDLLEIAFEVRKKWTESRASVKQITGMILTTRLDRIIEKGEGVSGRIESKIAILKSESKDTSGLEELLEKYNSNIEFAKEKNNAAKDNFGDIKDLESADELFREGHQYLREANTYLREAYSSLKGIIREMRRLASEEGV